MVDNNVYPRAQKIDESGNVVQGGSSLEIQVLSCTASAMGAMNFSEIPKAVVFQTRSGATDVEFTFGTNTVPQTASGGYWTIKGGETLSLDIANTGTFYFRNSASALSSIVIGVAIL